MGKPPEQDGSEKTAESAGAPAIEPRPNVAPRTEPQRWLRQWNERQKLALTVFLAALAIAAGFAAVIFPIVFAKIGFALFSLIALGSAIWLVWDVFSWPRSVRLAIAIAGALGGLVFTVVFLVRIFSANETPPPITISLKAEWIDADFDPIEYQKPFPVVGFGDTGNDPEKLREVFGHDTRYPIAPKRQYVRITIINLGALPILRLWLYFPVRYLIQPRWPATLSLSEQVPSALTPIIISLPNAPRASSTSMFLGGATVLAPGIPYTFNFVNLSGAYAMFYPLPTQATIDTTAGEQVVGVQSGSSPFLILYLASSLYITPNLHQSSRGK